MKNPLNFLTKKQSEVVKKELKEEGYVVLQRWTNKGKGDYRVLKDTVIITPNKIIDRIRWVFKRVVK